jgi:hypothetical protein
MTTAKLDEAFNLFDTHCCRKNLQITKQYSLTFNIKLHFLFMRYLRFYHNNVTNLIHFHYWRVESCGSTHNLQPANSYRCTQLTPKTASVVPPEDGRLPPETCGGLKHNKVLVKVEVY